MSSIGDRLCRDVSNLLREIVIRVVEVIFPQGSDADSEELFQFVVVNPAFSKHYLPELAGTEQDFVDCKKNLLVRIIKDSVNNIGKRDKPRRIELLSILYGSAYLQTLIQCHSY